MIKIEKITRGQIIVSYKGLYYKILGEGLLLTEENIYSYLIYRSSIDNSLSFIEQETILQVIIDYFLSKGQKVIIEQKNINNFSHFSNPYSSKIIHYLENYYSGDLAWNQFVNLYKEFWTNNSITQELLQQLNHHRDIAQVIYRKFGSSSLSIIILPFPALGNLSIANCIYTPHLIKRLKECLMRME